MLNQFLQDVRYAARMLVRAPMFTAVAILTLALGLGANTAIFTIVNALLLRPLPYGAPDRLVTVWQDLRARRACRRVGHARQLRRLAAGNAPVPERVGHHRLAPDADGRRRARAGSRRTGLARVLTVLGVRPALGRDFRSEDDVPNAARVVIISDGLWKRRFGGAADAVGRSMVLNGEPHEIIGVLPAGFRPIVTASADLWRPLRLNVVNPARGAVVLRAWLARRWPVDRTRPARSQRARATAWKRSIRSSTKDRLPADPAPRSGHR